MPLNRKNRIETAPLSVYFCIYVDDTLSQQKPMEGGNIMNQKLYSVLIGFSLTMFTATAFGDELGSNAKPIAFGADQTVIDFEKIAWKPLDVEGLHPGAQIAVIRGDLDTAGSEVVIKTPGGYNVAMHSHTSDETYVWLKGAYTLISEKGEQHRFAGPSYITFPGNAPKHAMTCDAKDYCLFYIRYSRPFDVLYKEKRMTANTEEQ